MRGAVALLLPLILSGCGTVVNLVVGAGAGYTDAVAGGTQIYGGIQFDIDLLGHEARKGGWSLLAVPLIALIDLPLSLVADTVTLVYTVPYVLSQPDPKASSP